MPRSPGEFRYAPATRREHPGNYLRAASDGATIRSSAMFRRSSSKASLRKRTCAWYAWLSRNPRIASVLGKRIFGRENARTWGFTLRRRNDWVRGRCDQSPHQFRHATVVLRPFGNRFSADDRGADCGERVAERLQPATTAVRCGHRGRDRDDFPFELHQSRSPSRCRSSGRQAG